jgi:hypothetical protein
MSVSDRSWVYAVRRGRKERSTERSGKWLVFVSREYADSLWDRIASATTEGKLGPSAKCGTAKFNSHSKSPKATVICVYTGDFEDKEDVMRVREELKALGITRRIPYKLDETTIAGRYSGQGDGNVTVLSA